MDGVLVVQTIVAVVAVEDCASGIADRRLCVNRRSKHCATKKYQ